VRYRLNGLLTYKDIENITQGEWLTKPKDFQVKIKGGTFDTRSLGKANIFFAWSGESGDGHMYLSQLDGSDMVLIVVEKRVPVVGEIPMLFVPDSLRALQNIAQELGHRFVGKIVTLTGSCGKTTIKSWLSYLLKEKFNVLSNTGSFNNHIGCPITILNLTTDHDLLLLEMGTSGLGELNLLSSLVPADITILLNVGHAHLGMFGSLENTYIAKTEIFNNQKAEAVSLIPSGDSRIKSLLKGKNYQLFGKGSPDFSWKNLEVDPKEKKQKLQFQTPEGNQTVWVNQLGAHVGDLLSAAIAVCYQLGLNWKDIEPKFSTLPLEKGRSTFRTGLNDVIILDDTYNANPESVANMLATLCSIPAEEHIAVIGNLAEMDENLKDSVDVIIRSIPQKLTKLFLSGETAPILKKVIGEHFPQIRIKEIQSIRKTIEALKPLCDKSAIIGVKGSRGSHTERIVAGLAGQSIQCEKMVCGLLKMCLECDEMTVG